jgi:hypothetical protein
MGFDHIDVLYSWTAPDGPPIEEIVDSLGDLIRPAVQQWRSRESRGSARTSRRNPETDRQRSDSDNPFTPLRTAPLSLAYCFLSRKPYHGTLAKLSTGVAITHR